MSDQADWAKTRSSEIENIDDPEKGGVEGSIAQTFVPVDNQRQNRRQVSPPRTCATTGSNDSSLVNESSLSFVSSMFSRTWTGEH